MLLPWSKLLRVQVGPRRIAATLQTGWPARKRTTVSFPPIDASPQVFASGGGPPDLDAAALDAVLSEIEQLVPLRGTYLVVEVADSLAHFDVAAGDFGAQSDRQLQSIAVACMAELLGDAALDFEVRWSLQPGERHLLIAAVPRALIATLVEACRLRAMLLDSVQPSFAWHWNACTRSIDDATAIVANASGHHAVTSCVVHRAICAVSTGPWMQERASESQAFDRQASPAQPMSALELLDEHAARLLASLGIAPGAESKFTLMTADAAPGIASQWVVVDPSGVSA